MNYFENVSEFQKKYEKRDKTLVFTNGCFDILHVGHIRYLSKSKSLGDFLVVGLNSDNSVKNLKGNNRPVNNQSDRAEVLLALQSVDFVVLFDEDTPLNLISTIKPDILTKGGDYTIETIVGADIVQNNGGQIIVVPFVEGKSTTQVLDKMRSDS